MAFDIVVGRQEKDRAKLGLLGTVLIGKQYIKMGRTTSLSNNVYLDIARSHVIFICGKRGGGKCLSGDTLITLQDGSMVLIKDLENDDRDIMALKDDLKISSSLKSAFYKRGVSRMLRITLRTGKQIELTPEHPLLTIAGWKSAQDLPEGSRIATPRRLGVFGEDDMPEERIKLLAYLLAEGHISNNFVLFSNMDEKIVADFNAAIYEFDHSLEIKQHSSPYCYRVVQTSRRRTTDDAVRDDAGRFAQGSQFGGKSSLREWLDELGIYGMLSGDKIIPEGVFKLPQSRLSLFLNRLFSCDGSLFKNGKSWSISYCSKSKQLIEQVHHLLLRFGIVSRYRKKMNNGFIAFELEIDGLHVSCFLQDIGFYGKKEERQRIALKEAERAVRNPNLDTIPKEIWDMYRPENWASVGREMGYATPKALRSSINYAPSRQKLLQIAQLDSNESIQMLAESDIYWDEIVSVEELRGEFTVYDITVPDHHNFVANDIIVHNSYTMGVIAEGMAMLPTSIKENLSFILLDTMGIYWTMKYPNKKDENLLAQWGMKSQPLKIRIFTPYTYHEEYKKKGLPTDYPFSLNADELDSSDWQMTFEISANDPIGVLLERIVHHLSSTKGRYTIDDMIEAVHTDDRTSEEVKNALENRLLSTKAWGVFSDKVGGGTPIHDLAASGEVTVLDVSCYATMPGGWKIKHLIVGLVSQKLFIQRMTARKDEEFVELHKAMHYFSEAKKSQKLKMPLVWLVIDEAHEFLPREGKNPATEPLVTIMREGRQPGISLILATQQPGKIHTDVMTQSDTVISHRITAKLDVDALGMLTQSYMREGLTLAVDNLPRVKGAAVLFDDTNERLYSMRIRPRVTWHGGEAPVAVKKKEKEL